MSSIGTYGETHAAFRWETPERFNFGRDVVDAWAGDHPAMIWLGSEGEERHRTFGDFSRLPNRFANAMRSLGAGRGPRVMVLLGGVPEWQAILTGLMKLGTIAIACGAPIPALDNRFEASDKRVRTPRPTRSGFVPYSGARGLMPGTSMPYA